MYITRQERKDTKDGKDRKKIEGKAKKKGKNQEIFLSKIRQQVNRDD